jgi:hypothetical protein
METLEIYYFSFDSLHIYGGYKNNVHVSAVRIIDEENQKDEDCILSIKRSMFMNIFNEWLDKKIDYCDRFGHYCGVSNVLCSAERLYDTTLYDYGEDEDDEITENKTTVYQVITFEIDMEHG